MLFHCKRILAKKRTRVSTSGGNVHFFYHKGDETVGWLLEAAEEEAANASDVAELIPAQESEASASDAMADVESDDTLAEETKTDIVSEE